MSDPFTTRVVVRHYELDTQGHVNGAVYVQWAEHARWMLVRAAGISPDELVAQGIGPVNLETTIRYFQELRDGDEVDVTCSFEWGDGKTFKVNQDFRKSDGELVAQLTSVAGFLDLKERRLLPDAAGFQRSVAQSPEALGLTE